MTDLDKLTYLGTTEAPKLEVPLAALGPPGIRQELHILAIVPSEERTDQERFADNSNRKFKVSAKLSKLPSAAGDLRADFSENDGSSYFVSPEKVHQHRIETPVGRFYVKKNTIGEMSFIEFECDATNVTQAQAKFAEAVYPFLDHLAYTANVPIHIAGLRIEDPKNYRTSFMYTAPFQPMTIATFGQELAIEMQPVYSLYREARNASSDFYRFLCYYKILEGLLGHMRASVYQRGKVRGIRLSPPVDRVPQSDAYPDALKIHIGKPIKQFFDNVLQSQFRDAMAHFATDNGGVLFLSDYAHQIRYANIILMTELCVRIVVANHEVLLRQLK